VHLSVWKVYRGKTADWIWTLFGVVREVNRGMGILDGVEIVEGKEHLIEAIYISKRVDNTITYARCSRLFMVRNVVHCRPKSCHRNISLDNVQNVRL